MKFSLLIRLFTAIVLIAAAGCNKSTEIGIGVLPGTDDVGAIFTDTFTLVTNTIREDSVLTSSTTNNTAGYIYDPVFGKISATFFTQFVLPTNDVDLGDADTLFIDSVVLTLAYNGYYGYKNVPQTFRIFRVTQDLGPRPENGYYSNNTFAFDPEPLGRKELFVPNFTDSVSALGVLFPPHMRIRLSDRFGQELLDQSGQPNFANDSSFKNFLKGICMAPDTVATPYASSILYFNLPSLISGLHLYWHTPTRDSLTYVFPISTGEIRSNFFTHNYTGTPLADHLQTDASVNDSLVFIQGAGGVKARIMIPHLSTLGNVVINKAEIVLTQKIDPGKSDSIFTTPPQIVCVTADSSGRDEAIPDASQIYPAPGGVKISKVTLGRETYAQYRFSVATQLQEIVSGQREDRGLFLIIFRRGESADRIMAGGNNRSDNLQMKLNLIYTRINE